MHSTVSHRIFILVAIISASLLLSCSEEPDVNPEPPVESLLATSVSVIEIESAPLSRLLSFRTKEPTRVSVKVIGKTEPNGDILHAYDNLRTLHQIEVHGLYAEHENIVEVIVTTEEQVSERNSLIIETTPLPGWLPAIDVAVANRSEMDGSMTLVSYRGRNNPNAPFIFDPNGEIRWYLDFMNDPELGGLFYDVGMERLKNGNWYFGSAHSNKIYEINMVGRIQNEWTLPPHSFHHTVVEKPNGNFLVTTSKDGSTNSAGAFTVEDYVIEIDRASGAILNEWDLKKPLNELRETMIAFTNPNVVDWFHANSVVFDDRDTTILVSGRTQGVVKLNYDNELVWILGPNYEWGRNQSSQNLSDYVLRPVDATGALIEDEDVIKGFKNHPEFEWNWYQHALELCDDGNLLLFDNGDNRNWGNGEVYSRAVEYAINEENMTVQQVWAFGKVYGAEAFSPIVSDVDALDNSNHVLFSPGAIAGGPSNSRIGRILEVNKSNGEVVFDARIICPPDTYIAFHRAERLSLYP